MLFVGSVYASSWGPVGLMSVWSKSITESAAYWGMITGFVFNVIPAALEYVGYITWPSYLHPAIIGHGYQPYHHRHTLKKGHGDGTRSRLSDQASHNP